MSDIPDALTQKVTRTLHDQGIEMTPAEVETERNAACQHIRAALRAKGYDVPESDLELLAWMKAAGL